MFLNGVAQSAGFAYAPNGNFGGLIVYNVSNPNNPTNIAKASFGSAYAYDLVLSGTKAFLASEGTGLEIYDISDPGAIATLGHTNNGGVAAGICVSGNYAYLATGLNGLWIYDISNPANPFNVGHTTNAITCYGVAVSGNYAYIAAGDQGLSVYDVSNPANPTFVAQTNAGAVIRNITVSGSQAYLQSRDGFRVYDISDPASPVYLGRNPINYGATTYRLAVAGSFVFLANGADGFRVWEVSNPSSPVEAGQGQNTNSSAPVISVAISRNYVYAANGGYGLSVFELSGPQLRVDLTGSAAVAVSWPTNSLDFKLQRTPNLYTGWLDVTNAPDVAGNRNVVTLPPGNGADFYRLRLARGGM